ARVFPGRDPDGLARESLVEAPPAVRWRRPRRLRSLGVCAFGASAIGFAARLTPSSRSGSRGSGTRAFEAMPLAPDQSGFFAGVEVAAPAGEGVRPERIMASITSVETPAARSFWMSGVESE